MLHEPTLAGTKLDRYFHVCAFFSSRDEEYGVMNAYYREAELQGEQMLHIVAPQNKDEHLARLVGAGIDAHKCMGCNQLQLLGWNEAYLDERGEFDQDRMLKVLDGAFAAGKAAGFPRLRVMGRALTGEIAGADQLPEYEARVNQVLARNRQPAVCVYDRAQLTSTMMMDVLRAHPLTLVGGVVRENPHYTPPEKLLPELRARRMAATVAQAQLRSVRAAA